MEREQVIEAVKSVPAITATGMTLFGYQLNDLVMLTTLVWTLFLIVTHWRDKWGGRGQIQRLMRWLFR